jgi:gliding motility-associated-like protein
MTKLMIGNHVLVVCGIFIHGNAKQFMRKLVLFFVFALLLSQGIAQTACTTLGQNPSSAFPVCGALQNNFVQTVVPICGGRTVPSPCNNTSQGIDVGDKNPFWYKFTCYVGGNFGFSITPNNLNDDYDWQLFDVTGRNPNDVYTNDSLFVSCNWSGEPGVTGAAAGGIGIVNCIGNGIPRVNRLIPLTQNHDYLLLVSHFDDTQSGYSISFNGGTAVINDPVEPVLQSVTPKCNAQEFVVEINKKVRCNTLTNTGSEFYVLPGRPAISSITAYGCTTGFDVDSILVRLAAPLAPGNYQLVIQNGTDGNTILDICGRGVLFDTIAFTIAPQVPPQMDSIARIVQCSPQALQVFISSDVLCDSIVPNGSDFLLTDPSGNVVNIASATGNCAGNPRTTKLITLQLSNPLVRGGLYQLTLRNGSDGNTLVSECNLAAIAGGSVAVANKDTVSARFTYTERLSCKADTVAFIHPGGNGITRWRWTFNDTAEVNTQNTTRIYRSFTPKTASLFVTNGLCSDSFSVTLTFPNNNIKAIIEVPEFVCAKDSAIILNKSLGNVQSWAWDFGNGQTSNLENPPGQVYPQLNADRLFDIRLTVRNAIGCVDSTKQKIKVLFNCFIDVPTAFTPNGDGLNDFLYPLNAFKTKDLVFRIFNRLGQLIFESRDWQSKWNGRINQTPQPSGFYLWELRYTEKDTKKKVYKKGTTLLIR